MKFERYLQNIKEPDKDKLKKEMSNQNLMQEIEMTYEEKIEMYMSCPIENLAIMHVELEKHFNLLMLDKTKGELLDWTLKQSDKYNERYMDNEKFLMQYLSFNFFKRLFLGKRMINEHLRKMLIKYNF